MCVFLGGKFRQIRFEMVRSLVFYMFWLFGNSVMLNSVNCIGVYKKFDENCALSFNFHVLWNAIKLDMIEYHVKEN